MKYEWNRLDNAAKIFPAADRKADSQVFRFSCELKENIDGEVLQAALDATLEVYDVYRYVLRRGIFWYYLEHSDIRAEVTQEKKPPCSPIYDKNRKKLLFEVSYYNRRINLEVYHVLSDGTGAMNFLVLLVSKYLCLKYNLTIPALDSATQNAMKDDGFSKYCTDKKSRKQSFKTACQLRGQKYSENRTKIITAHMDIHSVLSAAHTYKTTLTIFLTACFIKAIGAELSNLQKKRPVIVNVPVNLRNFFPSDSARNFFSVIYIDYDFSKQSGELPDIIEKVSLQFREKLSMDNLKNIINRYIGAEHNIFATVTPLVLKDFVLKEVYLLSMRRSTVGFSNVGIVKMPECLAGYVYAVDIISTTNKLQACACTFGDKLSISFTSPFINSDIQCEFIRMLGEYGISACISANPIDEE